MNISEVRTLFTVQLTSNELDLIETQLDIAGKKGNEDAKVLLETIKEARRKVRASWKRHILATVSTAEIIEILENTKKS